MKKFLIVILFMLCSVVSYSQIYASYVSNVYVPGYDNKELSSYVMWNMESIEMTNPTYLVQFNHDIDNLPLIGKILLKLENGNILDIKYTNLRNNMTNTKYKMQVLFTDNEINKIIESNVIKIRIENNNTYVDLKSNIFSILDIGYINIKNKIKSKSLYNNF